METVTDFIFLGSKIIADGDCSHEIKRCFASWKESYDEHRPLGTLIPFLSHQVPHTSHEQTSPGLSLVFISAGGAKRSQGIPGV